MGLFRRREANGEGTSRTPIVSIVMAMSVALLVLLDVVITHPFVDGVGALLIDYAVILAAFALLLGLLNVLVVHLRRVRQRGKGWPYSFLLVLVTVFLTAAGLVEGPEGMITQWSIVNLLLPLQSAFFSLLIFFLVGVLYQAARVRSVEMFLLLLALFIVVIGGTSLGTMAGNTVMVQAKEVLMAGPVTAGARALMLGVAIGTIVTALRLAADGRRIFK